MSLADSLNNLTNNAAHINRDAIGSVEAKLVKAAQIRGDFPTSLNLLSRIESVIEKPSSNGSELSKLIEADHLLTLRIISIANYEYYQGERPVHSAPAAIKHLGKKKIGELIGHLSEAKNFNAIYLGRAVSLTMMQQAIIASDMARQLARELAPQGSPGSTVEEFAYTLSVLSNIGPLLLAFYKPNIYSALCMDCLDDRLLFELVFKKVVGKSIGQHAGALVQALSLPKIYKELALQLDDASWEMKVRAKDQEQQAAVTAAYIANLIAHEICYFTGIQGIQSLVKKLDQNSPLGQLDLEDMIGTVADVYLEHTRILSLKPVRVPDYLLWFALPDAEGKTISWNEQLPSINERINPFLYELRQCLRIKPKVGEAGYFAHAVNCTLSALVKGLNFDRAVLFKVDQSKKFLQLYLCYGVKIFEHRKIRRFVEDPDKDYMPDILSYHQRKPVFLGSPVFPDGWPFVTFPIVWKDNVVGVFYADKIRRPDGDALGPQEEIACIALAEEWHDIPADFF